MGKLIDPVITAGTVMGRCPKCREPYMGKIDADEETVELECVNCHHKGKYFYNWPDELPKVTLRHWSNGRVLGGPRKRKRQKKMKINPLVLPGQMSLPGVFQ